MESDFLTLKGESERGKKLSMRRFGPSKRNTRCRNLCWSTQEGRAPAVRRYCDPSRAQEVCEVTFDAGVSITQRAYVLSQSELFCEMCGVAPGDIDDMTGNRAKFHIKLITCGDLATNGELSNLQTLCSTCEEGAKNITSVKPPAIWLLSQVRRAGQDEQRAVLDWLLKKFKK